MNDYIDNPYENFIAISRYARWVPSENRRETWRETVDRYFEFMAKHLNTEHGYIADTALIDELREQVFNRNIMPSMRS